MSGLVLGTVCAMCADSENRLVSPPSEGSSSELEWNHPRGHRPQRHLVGGIPFFGIGMPVTEKPSVAVRRVMGPAPTLGCSYR
jgi:hypothetical protein